MSMIKRKLSSNAGASMLLALMFLMFCLLVGGSVLAAATANAGRVENMVSDQQTYLSQRSAMLLMADMLKSADGSKLQMTITDVTVENLNAAQTVDETAGETQSPAENIERTVTFTIDGASAGQKNAFQKILYELTVYRYQQNSSPAGITAEATKYRYENFYFTGMSAGTDYTFPFKPDEVASFNIEADIVVDGKTYTETMTAQYESDTDGDFKITFTAYEIAEKSGAAAQSEGTEETQPPRTATDSSAYVNLTMSCSYNQGKPTVVTVDGKKITTVTTVIRWEDPVINKGAQ